MQIETIDEAYIVCEALKRFKDYLIEERDKETFDVEKYAATHDIMCTEHLILKVSQDIMEFEGAHNFYCTTEGN